jgi:hypothetical protein
MGHAPKVARLCFVTIPNSCEENTVSAPSIQTAIPKRRYQFGPYQVVLLGEVESPDPVRYQFILAFVRPGATKPDFFITSEKNPRARAAEGSHRMRVWQVQGDVECGSSNAYGNADSFVDAAFAEATIPLGIVGVAPVRVM